MLTAAQARSKAQNDLVIFNEVRDIEESILTASPAGNYDLTLEPAGYGHYKLISTRYGKPVSMITNDMPLIDKIKEGNNAARNEAIRMVRRHNFIYASKIN